MAGAEGVFQWVFDGSISGHHFEIDRRPYHRNCGCALHGSGGGCPHALRPTVSYPVRRSWSEGSLVMAMSTSATSPASSAHSPSFYGNSAS